LILKWGAPGPQICLAIVGKHSTISITMTSPGLPFIRRLFYSQWFITPPYPTESFKDQVIIVTGANVGLGLEAARHFVRLDAAKVIIACRSIEKGEAAKKDIESTTNRTGVVDVWQLDLGSFDSVKAFGKRIESLPRLDVLLENAGVSVQSWRMLEGHEESITVNVISTFLLALLALPKLKASAKKFNIKPHLCIVSSEVHIMAGFKERQNTSKPIFEVLKDEKLRTTDSYQISKLLEVLVVREITETSAKAPYPVVINMLNPGFCHSALIREMNSGMFIFMAIVKVIAGARTTEVGSRTLVNAAQFGPESHGKFLSDAKVDEVADWIRTDEGKETQVKVWSELQGILEKIQPGVTKNI
jgi:retinol dehydrogenase-12